MLFFALIKRRLATCKRRSATRKRRHFHAASLRALVWADPLPEEMVSIMRELGSELVLLDVFVMSEVVEAARLRSGLLEVDERAAPLRCAMSVRRHFHCNSFLALRISTSEPLEHEVPVNADELCRDAWDAGFRMLCTTSTFAARVLCRRERIPCVIFDGSGFKVWLCVEPGVVGLSADPDAGWRSLIWLRVTMFRWSELSRPVFAFWFAHELDVMPARINEMSLADLSSTSSWTLPSWTPTLVQSDESCKFQTIGGNVLWQFCAGV